MEWKRCVDQLRVREWVLEQMPHPQEVGPLVALGYEVEGNLVAGFLFDNYNPEYRSVEFHTCIERPAGSNGAFYRAILSDVAAYMFGQLNCQRISAYIPVDKPKSARFLQMCGFKLEGRLRRAFGTADALVYALLDDEAPAWLFTRRPPPLRMEASQ